MYSVFISKERNEAMIYNKDILKNEDFIFKIGDYDLKQFGYIGVEILGYNLNESVETGIVRVLDEIHTSLKISDIKFRNEIKVAKKWDFAIVMDKEGKRHSMRYLEKLIMTGGLI